MILRFLKNRAALTKFILQTNSIGQSAGNAGALGNTEYHFIAIAPMST